MPQVKEVKGKMRYTADKEEILRLAKNGNVTPNGIFFYDELAGPEGVWICLFPTGKHTKKDVKLAKSWLRNQRDVVRFSTGVII